MQRNFTLSLVVAAGSALPAFADGYNSSRSISYGSNVTVIVNNHIPMPAVAAQAERIAAFEEWDMRTIRMLDGRRDAHLQALQLMASQPRMINVSPYMSNTNSPYMPQTMSNWQYQHQHQKQKGKIGLSLPISFGE